jgi:hypothetical protein
VSHELGLVDFLRNEDEDDDQAEAPEPAPSGDGAPQDEDLF